jgi:Xaa-Pro dipeptidase
MSEAASVLLRWLMNLDAVQAHMREQRIDAWLLYDFKLNNPVVARWLCDALVASGSAKPGEARPHLTRRVFWLVPASGAPRILCHRIDDQDFKKAALAHETYDGWRDLRLKVGDLLTDAASESTGGRRIAMEYSPGGALPTAGIVDAGTIEFIRSLGAEVVSSADLMQLAAGLWRERGLASHQRAIAHCDRIMAEAFGFIREKLRSAGASAATHEREVQMVILDRFKAAGLVTDSDPIIGVNANAADCHYSPDDQRTRPIRRGDWVLIDLWAKEPGDGTVYGDITWTGFCGPLSEVSAKRREVFQAVLAARDASFAEARARWSPSGSAGGGGGGLVGGVSLAQGWQLDEAARRVIIAAGYEHALKHRTGHSLSPGTPGAHGVGMNLDAIETHDTRLMLPGTGFTIEPGIYLDGDFGVRSEVNVHVDPAKGPIVTGAIQREIVAMG